MTTRLSLRNVALPPSDLNSQSVNEVERQIREGCVFAVGTRGIRHQHRSHSVCVDRIFRRPVRIVVGALVSVKSSEQPVGP